MRRAKMITLTPRALLIVTLIVVALAVIAVGRLRLGPFRVTRIEVYDPKGFTATEEVAGNCWTGSLAAPRAGAYRCAADSSIFDPCFSVEGEEKVACPQGDPAANRGVLIALTEPLPTPPDAWDNPPDLANPSPWEVELIGGGVCGVLTGTRPPEYPLGCRIPDMEGPEVCAMPSLLANSRGVYTTTCGVWEGPEGEVVQRSTYIVSRMWL